MGSNPTLGTNFFSVVYRHYYPPFGIGFERDNGYFVRCVAHSEVSVETRIALLNNDWSSAAGQLDLNESHHLGRYSYTKEGLGQSMSVLTKPLQSTHAAHPVSGINDCQISDTFTSVGYYDPTTDVASFEAKH